MGEPKTQHRTHTSSRRRRLITGVAAGTAGNRQAGEATGMTGQGTNSHLWALQARSRGPLSERSSKKGGLSPFGQCSVTARGRRAPALHVDDPTLGLQTHQGEKAGHGDFRPEICTDLLRRGPSTSPCQHLRKAQRSSQPTAWKGEAGNPCPVHRERAHRMGWRVQDGQLGLVTPVPPPPRWPTYREHLSVSTCPVLPPLPPRRC